MARKRGATRYPTGWIAMVSRAITSSLIFMEASTAVYDAPTRAVRMMAVITG